MTIEKQYKILLNEKEMECIREAVKLTLNEAAEKCWPSEKFRHLKLIMSSIEACEKQNHP